MARVVQPTPAAYNGQGVIQPSHFISLADEGFMAQLAPLWDAHVDFGTNRSHKKLLGKRRRKETDETQLPTVRSASGSLVVESTGNTQHPPSRRPAVAAAAASAGSVQQPPAAPKAAALSNKGRFAGTLAARLLGET